LTYRIIKLINYNNLKKIRLTNQIKIKNEKLYLYLSIIRFYKDNMVKSRLHETTSNKTSSGLIKMNKKANNIRKSKKKKYPAISKRSKKTNSPTRKTMSRKMNNNSSTKLGKTKNKRIKNLKNSRKTPTNPKIKIDKTIDKKLNQSTFC